MSEATEHTQSELQVLGNLGYKLGRKLGEGSYAKVFLAEYCSVAGADKDPVAAGGKPKDKLACKIIDTSRAPKDFVRKFLPRELDIILKLHHPHIIHMHSIWQRRSKYFIFMRFAERGDLLDFVLRNGAVSEDQARFWLRQMALAIQYLHEMDIAHRDLKCENVLISDNYNVKLADFGFARRVVDAKGRPVLSDTYCGSLSYAAPEVLKGTPYNPKTADLWSLGVILFVILNKAMPFDDANVKRMHEQQLNRRWKFRSRVADSLSDNVKRLTTSMLEPDTTKRISVDQVVQSDFIAMKPELVPMSPDEKQALMQATVWKRKNRAEGGRSEAPRSAKGQVTAEEAARAAAANLPEMHVLQAPEVELQGGSPSLLVQELAK